MSIFSTSRISFLRETFTRGQIQKQTGIHWARQEAVLSGTKTLSVTERQSLTRMYRRETYIDLRNAGMSVSQSKRFRGYAPPSIHKYISIMDSTIETLAKGVTAKKMAVLDSAGIPYNIRDLIDEMHKKVLEGMKKSKRMYEDWLDYAAEE